MKRLFFVLTCLLPGIVLAQWRYNALSLGTINDMVFTDRYAGYAVFQTATLGSCPSSHGLFKTIDEGHSWIRMSTGTSNNIVAVHFVNQLTGWIAASGSEVRKTTDGGATWTQQTVGVGSGYNDIYFKDANSGFVLGNNGLLRRSLNGGASWTTITSGVTSTLRRMTFSSANLGFISCSNNQLLRTSDGGTTWSVIALPSPGFTNLFFTTPTTGFASHGNNLARTTDGGLTWTTLSIGATHPTGFIHFPTANIGYVWVNLEGLYKTTDGGLTWALVSTPNAASESFNPVFFTDQNHGHLAGHNGRIAKTTDGGISWHNTITGLSTDPYTVHAPHKDTAYIGTTQGGILKTVNGGTSFFQAAKLVPGSSRVQKVFFRDTQRGFAVVDSGRVFKTTDGGETWVQKPTNSLTGFIDVQFITDSLGFICGGTNGWVMKSTDAGETWSSIGTGLNETYTDLWFINEDTGFVMNTLKVMRTLNGGVTWTSYTPVVASGLQDITFVNDSLGYCAGSFGKVLYTTNTGTTWQATNNDPSNADIRDMWFANAGNGYFAKFTSQYQTTDSCKTITSISTACLSTSSTNSISMTNGGSFGYVVAASPNSVHQSGLPEIIRAYTSTNAYCPGAAIFVAYHAKGLFGGGNSFTAELSDANGSFASPTTIGTYMPAAYSYQSGVITATIPSGLSGNNFRVRVVSSSPVIVSPDNGFPIAIGTGLQPSVTLQNGTLGPVCAGTPIILTATGFAGGLNPAYSWTVNGQPVPNSAYNLITSTLHNGDTVRVAMVSNLSCANTSPVYSNEVVVAITEPLLDLGNDTSACLNSSLQLAGPAGYAYAWLPGTGLSSSSIRNPVATITANIQYRLTITDSAGCSSTDSIHISANPLPQFSLGTDTVGCILDSILLQGPAGYSYAWQPSTGLSNPSGQSTLAGISSNIQYTLTVTDTSGCMGMDSISITASVVPPFSLGADTSACEEDSVALQGPGGYTYAWLPQSGLDNPFAQSPIAGIDTTVMYALTVSDSIGCTRSDSILVHALTRPVFALANDTSVCEQSTMMLNGPAGYSYAWLPPSGLNNPSAQSPIAVIDSSIQYILTVTDSVGCSRSDSILILAAPLPQVRLGSDTALCQGACVLANGSSSGTVAQIVWNPIAGISDTTILNPLICPSVTTSYSVTVISSDQCTGTASLNITVSPVPATPQITFNGFTLSTDPSTTYQWLLNGNPIPGANGISYIPTVSGNYAVIVTNSADCSAQSVDFPVIINGMGTDPWTAHVNLFPNPARNAFELVLGQTPIFPVTVRIIDAGGSLVYHASHPASNRIQIVTGALATGIYTVEISLDSTTVRKRLAIMN